MKNFTARIINCVGLVLFAAGISQAANQSGALLEIKGTVTRGDFSPLSVDLVVTDGAIHSGAFRTIPVIDTRIGHPCTASDAISSDSYVLQGGSPTGCDTGDDFETTQSPGIYKFKSNGPPAYEFDITTSYQVGGCSSSEICANPDTGLLTVSIPYGAAFSFTGTISLSGMAQSHGAPWCPLSDGIFDSATFGDRPLGANGSVTLALSPESSNCGGFTSNTTVGESAPVAAGTTTTLLADGPLTQTVTLFAGTNLNGVASMRDVLMLVDGSTCDALVNNGVSNVALFGGSPVPTTATCTLVTGNKAAILSNECFDVNGNQLADCKGIEPPANHPVIGLSSNFSNTLDPKNPGYVIAEDMVDDFTNVTDSFIPGCTSPPCNPGGGPHRLNGRETIVDLNLTCQVLTFAITPSSVHPGQFITVKGTIGGCAGVSRGLLTFTFEGPLRGDDNSGPCTQRKISIPKAPPPGVTQGGFPIGLPSTKKSFSFFLPVLSQSCTGTFKLSTTINAGSNVFYNNPAPFTVF